MYALNPPPKPWQTQLPVGTPPPPPNNEPYTTARNTTCIHYCK